MPYPTTMAERRRMRALRRGEMARRDAWCTAVEVAVAVGWALFIAAALLLAAGCAGRTDAELEAAELAYWQDRGVEVQRW